MNRPAEPGAGLRPGSRIDSITRFGCTFTYRFRYQLTPTVATRSLLPIRLDGVGNPNAVPGYATSPNRSCSTRAASSTAPPCNKPWLGSSRPCFFSPVMAQVPARYHAVARMPGKSPSKPIPLRSSDTETSSLDTDAGPDSHTASTPARTRLPFTYTRSKNTPSPSTVSPLNPS